jgi:glutamate-1-semialdehyde aminotransferase
MRTIDRSRIASLIERERASFRQRHAQSGRLAEQAKRSLLFGVPMNWMTRWPGDHPVFVDRAAGARFWDVDGNEFIDFCLGDTGGMAGHAPKAAVDAISRQAARGITLMLPTADAAWVGDEMARRFGVPYWQFTLSATDANRCVIRWAREITGRLKIVVHNWCYHGSVDETVAILDDGHTVARKGNIGKPVALDATTRVVEINDLAALEAALAAGDVAACLVRARAHSTSASCCQSPAITSRCARCAPSTARSWSSMKRIPSAPARAVAPWPGASIPTSSRSARLSAPASRAAPMA